MPKGISAATHRFGIAAMEALTANELREMIAARMSRPEGVFLTVAPNPAGSWHVTVSASGEPSRATRYNQMAQEIAAELRQKYSLKI
jgi:hypothetical protein